MSSTTNFSLQDENSISKALLEHADQALFLFGRDGVCATAASASCTKVMGRDPGGLKIADALNIPANERKNFSGWCELLFDDLVDFADLTRVGPQTLSGLIARVVTLEFSPVRNADGHLEAVVVCATDRTNEMRARGESERLQAFANMILTVSKDRERFNAFVESTRKIFSTAHELLDGAALNEASWVEVKRCMHALKNAAGVFEIKMIRESIERLESKLSVENDLRLIATLVRQTVYAIEDSFESVFGQYRDIFSDLTMQGRPSRSVPLDLLETIGNRLKSMDGSGAKRLYYDLVDEIIAVPFRNVFGEFDRLIQDQAKKSGKVLAPIKCIGDEMAIMPEGLENLRTALGHIFSNIVDHGIETGDLRTARGKSVAGEIVVEFRRLEDEFGPHLRLIVNDDGNGVDVDHIRRLLQKIGKPTDNLEHQQLADHIFDVGLTTGHGFKGFSGHSLGLHTVKTEVEHLGGSIRVHSDQGKGTAFVIELPLDESGHAPRLKSRPKAA